MSRSLFSAFAAGILSALLVSAPSPAAAVNLTIDQIIYEPSAGLDSSQLGATATATVSGSTLTIVLTNTTGLTGGDSSALLLTGIGFELPDGVGLTNTGASVSPGSAGSYKIGGTTYPLAAGDDLRGEWGGGSPDGSGPFANVATLGVDYVAATLQSAFFDGSAFDPSAMLKIPVYVDGPEFGLLSSTFTDAGGLGFVRDSLTLTWDWTGSGLTEDFLNNGNVVVSFGSPTAVPEPGTLSLLGIGLIGLAGWGRMKFRR